MTGAGERGRGRGDPRATQVPRPRPFVPLPDAPIRYPPAEEPIPEDEPVEPVAPEEEPAEEPAVPAPAAPAAGRSARPDGG